ncbi:tRNA (N6-threonylcarbamoyladenosine(37)-N6)-methyltransferase TrmO [Desulfopila aestuarii]|uniref:tRNA-Thr(GGU) m(6)t(6)A37 methyltransferase TsaA n=1 Tax=Desulfopila aestuarii DSM 18488 TaxID=1121416 RepID=A0A1M7YGF1_9BACT|nr:tRNA (N6-threonylcarbamoyladenosine(37)-N6)-methyltransferase TrmO [Desulfopila aestuarii]SHO51717.1 tRNA-Thr(GGU) m(6)t(6)A37 methyltransferase TsaA [Desulfopila aestuarii DSM 18488]
MQTIGIIHTPFTNLEDMPIQPAGASDIQGEVVVHEEFAEGLRDLEDFSHIYLIYQFHKATRTELTVVPFMDTVSRGVYATRSPLRPNHIGISIVNLVSVKGNTVNVRGIDILDGTPLLDIKPFIAAFDQVAESRDGWMTATSAEVARKRSDTRFV